MDFNLSKLDNILPEDLAIYLRDDQGELIAGVIGETHGNWLLVKYLWVDGQLRGQKVGSTILRRAEEEAMKRSCKFVFLDTFSFQAPNFYKKQGYEEVFRLKEYPKDGERIYLTKKL